MIDEFQSASVHRLKPKPEMNLRRFPKEIEVLANQWYRTPVSDMTDVWHVTGFTLAGSTNLFQVKNKNGLLGWAKPGLCDLHDAELYAAREKIASDLGYLLGFPIPPVLLKKVSFSRHRIGWVAISVSPFENLMTLRQFDSSSWDDVLLTLPDEERDYFNSVASAALVFDVILDNDDQNQGNVLIKDRLDASEEFGVAMVDYAWAARNWHQPSIVMSFNKGFYGTEKDENEMLAFATRYQLLQPDDIREIINRLPDEVLSADNKNLMERHLLVRQSQIVPLVERVCKRV